MPNGEAQQRPQDARAVVAAGEVVVEETADHGRIEVTQSPQPFGGELVFDHAAQLVTQPLGGRAHEAPLRCAQMLVGKAAPQRALQQSLVLPEADLDVVREREHALH